MTSPSQDLFSRLKKNSSSPYIWDRGLLFSAENLLSEAGKWSEIFRERGISPGDVVGLRGDFSLPAVSLLLALLKNKNIAALIPPSAPDVPALAKDGGFQIWFDLASPENPVQKREERGETHPLVQQLREENKPGLVIFSSGTTGKAKAILHDAEAFLGKFLTAKKNLKTAAFLLLDHVAGLDTLFYSLFSGSQLALLPGRDPKSVCDTIEKAGVEVLPASPTFLRLLCLSGQAESRNLSSLKVIAYGSEPMDAGTLERLRTLFPNVRLVQRYGTSELGSPRSQSREDGSLWLRMGDENFKTKVEDGILWIKTAAAMRGYLNAENPPMKDGWICTGDAVETDGEWMKILGRKSDLIIVGGEKVFPQEVEEAILALPEFSEAKVWGEDQPLMGKMVAASVLPVREMDEAEALKIIRRHCRGKLAPYKIPVKVQISDQFQVNDRMKKNRIPTQ